MAITKRRRIFAALPGFTFLMLAAATARAHGGLAGPDELGPPVITSVVLGVASYWTVLLWPSRRRPEEPRQGTTKSYRRPVATKK